MEGGESGTGAAAVSAMSAERPIIMRDIATWPSDAVDGPAIGARATQSQNDRRTDRHHQRRHGGRRVRVGRLQAGKRIHRTTRKMPVLPALFSSFYSRSFHVGTAGARQGLHRRRGAAALRRVARGRAFVAAHNAGSHSWEAGLNCSDLTWDEYTSDSNPALTPSPVANPVFDPRVDRFKSKMLMAEQNTRRRTPRRTGGQRPMHSPESIDYATSALNRSGPGSLRQLLDLLDDRLRGAHHFLKYGVMKSLSEQQLVDCADAFNNHGCNGGLPSQALEYLMYAGGHDNETAYPYTAKTGKTYSFKKTDAIAKVAWVNNITSLDEDELKLAVGYAGPVSIAYQVSHDFRYYKKGVYDGKCEDSPSSVNHAVVAVGYGYDDTSNKPYWTVRNSWGTSFGMDGYFKIKRGVNKCGLADCASFPTAA